MKLPDSAKAVILQFAAKFPLATTDEASREWTHKLCEQLAYSFPTDGFCHKSAGEGRPHSADCIAIRAPFWGWDIINASGSTQATLSLDGDHIDLTGQLPERVTPTDYLGEPEPPTPPSDLEARVATLEDDMLRLKQAMSGWIIHG